MSPKTVLFGEQFKRLHGLSVDQALAGYERFSDQVLTPEQAADVRSHFKWAERHTPVSEITPEPIDKQLNRWALDHRAFLVGNSAQVAKNLVHLDEHMQGSSRLNEVPLYRGATKSPAELARIAPDYPQSFTTDRFVAQSFAKPSYTGIRGRIWKQQPGTVRGLLLSDYGFRSRTVGRNRRPESEFLVDPRSMKEEK